MRISDWSSDVCSSDLLGASGAVSASFEGLLTVSGGSDLTAGIVQVNGTTQTVTLSDALAASAVDGTAFGIVLGGGADVRSEEHTSELQSLMRISYAVLCLKKKKNEIQLRRSTCSNIHRHI